jgi:hypothetical protein
MYIISREFNVCNRQKVILYDTQPGRGNPLEKDTVTHVLKNSQAELAARESGKHFIASDVTVKPKDSTRLGLGIYPSTEPDPVFDVAFDPDMGDAVGASLERLDIPGEPKYMLLYHFNNYGDQPCRISVKLHQNAAA